MANQDNRGDSKTVHQKSQESKLKELENIFAQADEASSEQINFGFAETMSIKLNQIEATQNPDEAYRLYYNILSKLKRDYIPKGKVGKPIRDEINLFLKEGKTKSDGRMAKTFRMAGAINLFTDWVSSTKGKNLMDLYLKFYEVNKK